MKRFFFSFFLQFFESQKVFYFFNPNVNPYLRQYQQNSITSILLWHLIPFFSQSLPDAPIVSLSLGSNLDPKNLAKGTDVYLECRIEANPPIKKIEWYHNNKPLQPTRGVIITNQSLVLQSISKQTHGQYMCRAYNTQGAVSSNDLYLDIKCKSRKQWNIKNFTLSSH